MEVPFRFEVAVRGNAVSGWFFNGEERVTSSSGSLDAGHLVLDFDSYARRLDVTLQPDGSLVGLYAPSIPGSTAVAYPFHAARTPAAAGGAASASPAAAPPSIAGLWIVPAESRKAGEKAWRLIVRQHGDEVSAAILRVDGDSGALTGHWRDGKLVLSHFDGARPALIDLEPGSDGTLALEVHSPDGADRTLTAYRARSAARQGIEAADPTRHTSVVDLKAPFQFRFPDLAGHVIANTDPRFRGKVMVIDVAGSWCPNCHDEAPLLEALYRKYRARGLEVITLAFEEPEQLADPVRLRAFVRDFGLEYTVLLAGSPQELHDKLPQATGLDAYPTTFFIGRDGRVRGVHAGFAAPATGAFNTRLKEEFATTIERLLAEKG